MIGTKRDSATLCTEQETDQVDIRLLRVELRTRTFEKRTKAYGFVLLGYGLKLVRRKGFMMKRYLASA